MGQVLLANLLGGSDIMILVQSNKLSQLRFTMVMFLVQIKRSSAKV